MHLCVLVTTSLSQIFGVVRQEAMKWRLQGREAQSLMYLVAGKTMIIEKPDKSCSQNFNMLFLSD